MPDDMDGLIEVYALYLHQHSGLFGGVYTDMKEWAGASRHAIPLDDELTGRTAMKPLNKLLDCSMPRLSQAQFQQRIAVVPDLFRSSLICSEVTSS